MCTQHKHRCQADNLHVGRVPPGPGSNLGATTNWPAAAAATARRQLRRRVGKAAAAAAAPPPPATPPAAVTVVEVAAGGMVAWRTWGSLLRRRLWGASGWASDGSPDMNLYLDIFNGRRLAHLFGPYDDGTIKSVNDPKLEELVKILLWFYEWEKECGEEKHHFLSQKCYYDLKLSILGFVGMCCRLLTLHPGCYFSARNCSQDSLENHFGHLRSHQGDGNNPTLAAAQRGEQVSFVSRALKNAKGNSGGAQGGDVIDTLLVRTETEAAKKRRAEAKETERAATGI